jgi:hypothetical protein
MRLRSVRIVTVAALVAIVAAMIGFAPGRSDASSHREAPLISLDPTADNTDLYAFISPDRPDTVTIIANYIPLEEPNGGPNFASFDDNVLYEINIDNSGDGREDLKYQFRFTTTVRNPDTWLYNTGPITSLDDPNRNVVQTYNVFRVRGSQVTKIASNLLTPPPNIGPRSTPNYDQLSASAVADLPGGGKVFAGQVDDPFFVDLGSIFDLGGLRPFNNFHLLPLDPAPGVDGVSGYATHATAIQVPITELTRGGVRPTDPKDPRATIGIYASASRQKFRILNERTGGLAYGGQFIQVSRLGNPLINEVVIPLGKKDYWNASHPANDKQFVKYYTNPSLAAIINTVYPALPDAPTSDRSDLVAVLLTGVPGLNYTGPTQADLLRLNVAIPPTANPSRLAVIDGDFQGFPNGRRLADDVTDIELRAVACGYGPILEQALGLCNLSPNNQVGDGVDANDRPFRTAFPYAATPFSGYFSPLHTPATVQ